MCAALRVLHSTSGAGLLVTEMKCSESNTDVQTVHMCAALRALQASKGQAYPLLTWRGLNCAQRFVFLMCGRLACCPCCAHAWNIAHVHYTSNGSHLQSGWLQNYSAHAQKCWLPAPGDVNPGDAGLHIFEPEHSCLCSTAIYNELCFPFEW